MTGARGAGAAAGAAAGAGAVDGAGAAEGELRPRLPTLPASTPCCSLHVMLKKAVAAPCWGATPAVACACGLCAAPMRDP